jgi:hypothetical protein
MADELPSDFDWVSQRARCSAPQMFEALRGLAQVNVDTVNQLKGGANPDGPRFRLSDTDPTHRTSFTVSDTLQSEHKGVNFWIDHQKTIHVEPTHQNRRGGFIATPTLNDRGQCRLLVDSHELDTWQLLRRALEWLFFDDRV